MKNFMTFSIGALCYIIGYFLMYGSDVGGVIGSPFIGILGSQYITNADGVNVLSLNVYWFYQALFAATCAAIVSGAVAERMKFGVLSGGDSSQLLVQMLGLAACGAYSLLMSFIYFSAVKKVFGLRVKKEEEIKGLDSSEHAVSAYNITEMLDI